MHILIKTFDYLDIWLNFSALLFISTLDNTYYLLFRASKVFVSFHKKDFMDKNKELFPCIVDF